MIKASLKCYCFGLNCQQASAGLLHLELLNGFFANINREFIPASPFNWKTKRERIQTVFEADEGVFT